MTSWLSWLPQLWRANWALGNQVHRWIIAIFGGVWLTAIVACVYLSAAGLPEIIGLIGALYIFMVLVVPLHPVVWEALAVGGYIRGQFGGKEGLSVLDGVERVKAWAKVLVDEWGKYLLFYGTVPFVWTAINDTEGAILWHLALLPLIPLAIYFSVKRWPDSKRIFNTIGRVYILLVFLAVGVSIYTTVQHHLADPSTKVILAYERAVKKHELTDDKKAAEYLIWKQRAGEQLTAKEAKVWAHLLKKSEGQKVKSALRNLVDNTRDLVRWTPSGLASWWRESSPIDVQASAKLDQEREGYLRKEAANCANELAKKWRAETPPTPKEEADCRKKQDAVQGVTTTPAATPAKSSAAEMLNRGTAAVSGSNLGKRVEYTPTRVTGPVTLGDFPSGKYVLRCDGKRYQRYGWGDESNGKYDDVEVDCHGRATIKGGNTAPAPSSAPLAGPNGRVIVYYSGPKPVWVDECFEHSGGRIRGGINVGPGDYRGSGSLDLWVEEGKDC